MSEDEENVEVINFLLHYSGIVKVNSSKQKSAFRGVVFVKKLWFQVEIICPNLPRITATEFKVQHKHHFKRLNEHSSGVKPNWTIYEFIENLPNLLKDEIIPVPKSTSSNPLQQNIYSEISELYAPDSYTIHLDADCTHICFSKFEGHEDHYLELELPTLFVRNHSLPDCISLQSLFAKCTPFLRSLLEQFQKYLNDLNCFYENFVDIDELCHVVQPSPATTKDNWRLFLLRDRVFLKLVLHDPFAPLSSMSIQIIGPTRDVEPLRRTYSDGLLEWDAEMDILKNLLRIFDLIFFPMPPEDNTGQQLCNICYSYRLGKNEPPIVSCDNPQCSLIFHAACIKEWFNTLSDCKTFLDVSFGSCPFCKTKLSTSFKELLDQKT